MVFLGLQGGLRTLPFSDVANNLAIADDISVQVPQGMNGYLCEKLGPILADTKLLSEIVPFCSGNLQDMIRPALGNRLRRIQDRPVPAQHFVRAPSLDLLSTLAPERDASCLIEHENGFIFKAVDKAQ